MNTVIEAPFGRLLLTAEANYLIGIEFMPADTPLGGGLVTGVMKDTIDQLEHYFADPTYVFDVRYLLKGTPYQQQVWTQIANIPSGQTRCYHEIATALGSSPRAVGGACGRNPLPIVIPCHRVVAANGLGGFSQTQGGSWLMEVKRWLLRHEGVLQSLF